MKGIFINKGFIMRGYIKKLLKEALEVSKYRQWSSKNDEMAHRAWATQAHLYDRYFLPIEDRAGLENLRDELLPKLDENGREAFIVFYLYKRDVLDGKLNEIESK